MFTPLGLFCSIINQEKEIKCILVGKEELKLCLFIDDMILYVEKSVRNPHTIRAIKFIKLMEYKINIQQSLVFLNTSNEQSKYEI